MRRFAYSGLLAAGLALSLNACGETSRPATPDDILAEHVLSNPQTVLVEHGHSVKVKPLTDAVARQNLEDEIPLTGEEIGRGFEDSKAPIVSNRPVRVVGRLANSRNVGVRNDVVCNTVNLNLGRFPDPNNIRIGVLVLADQKTNLVQINWANTPEDQVGTSLQVCVNPDQPVSSVILAATNKSQ